MPPTPKPAATRQRRNKTSTNARLKLAPSGIRAPALPSRKGPDGKVLKWHPRTRAWWKDVWASPMATEFLNSDRHELIALAELEDAFNHSTETNVKLKLAAEIRMQRQAFGLTPIDRRRLQWEVERIEGSKSTPRKRAPKKKAKDPRSHLRAV